QTLWVGQYNNAKLWAFQNVRSGEVFTSGKLLQLNIASGFVSVSSQKTFNDTQIAFSIAHDGADLWYSDGDGPLYQLDDGRWMSVDTISSTVSPDTDAGIQLSINPKRRNGGLYTGSLMVASNDPALPMISVPVSLQLHGTPVISVSPSVLEFQFTYAGDNRILQTVITNTGTDVLNITGLNTTHPAFTVNPNPIQILPGASASLSVNFSPSEAGVYSETLHLVSNDPLTPVYNVILSATAGLRNPEIQVSAFTLNFGSVVTGGTVYQDLTISNTGTNPLQISDIQLSPNAFTTLTPDFSVPVGGNRSVRILFSPVVGGSYDGTAIIYSNDPDTPQLQITLSGFAETGIPSIALSPVYHNFGALALGNSSTTNILVANQGNGTLVIDQLLLTEPAFTTITVPIVVSAGENHIIPVTFTPSQNQSYTAELIVQSNDPNTPQAIVNLEGEGYHVPIISVSPLSIDRYIVQETIQEQTLTILNTGLAALNFTLALSGTPTWLSLDTTSGTIPENSSAEIILSFDTTVIAAGTYQSTLFITNNSEANPLVSIPITLVHSDFNFTTTDNENNARDGVPDGDLDVNINEYASIWPVEFNIFTDQTTASEVILRVRAFNTLANEISQVWLNGNYLGNLRSSPNAWATSQFRIPLPYLNLGINAANDVEIRTDTSHVNSGTSRIDWGQLLFNPDSPFANVRYFYVTSSNHYPGSSVTMALETDTQLYSQNIRAVVSLLDGQGNLLDTNTYYSQVSYGLNEPVSPGFTIPADSPAGTYSLSVNVFDNDTDVLQDTRNAVFEVGTYQPQISILTNNIDFGQVFTNQTSNRSVTIRNLGLAPLQISNMQVSGEVFWVDGALYTLHYNQSVSVNLGYNPLAPGSHSATLSIYSNDLSNPVYEVQLTGTAVDPPIITVDLAQVEKQLYTSETGTEQILITNTGATNLFISSIGRTFISGSNWLSVSPGSGNLAPGNSMNVTLNFNSGSLSPGYYQANIVINSNDPVTGNKIIPVTLQVNPRPVADFTANPTTGLNPLTVQFTDTSTPTPGATITSWLWDFKNNGTATSTDRHPSYTYTVPGTYSVKLTVTTDTGLVGTYTRTSYIIVQNNPPVVINQPEPISMMANTSNNTLNLNTVFHDPDFDTLLYSYTAHPNFSIQIQQGLVTITPQQYWSGVAVLSFTARDGRGGTASVSVQVTVQQVNNPPQLNLPDSVSFLKNTQLIMDFNPYVFDPDVENSSLTISITNTTNILASVNGMFITLSASAGWSGTELITVSVSDGIEAQPTSASLQINVLNEFNADFYADSVEPLAGIPVQFHDTTIGNPNYWEWQFEYVDRISREIHRTTYYEQHPIYTFNFGGFYTVSLLVGYDDGSEVSATDLEVKEDYIFVRGTLVSGTASGFWPL
ncbi:MAG: choice-of-anchor D domain-containing protein, partial [Candidatus Cloacimonadaceae bacterium]|nr:choice-of-anchor D domain-containing protein [Candidatus Cloacimonadaceae bacterium]